jgi:hypothetical protein
MHDRGRAAVAVEADSGCALAQQDLAAGPLDCSRERLAQIQRTAADIAAAGPEISALCYREEKIEGGKMDATRPRGGEWK